MEFLRRIFKQIDTQLKGLRTAEKFVIFLLLALVCVSIYLLSMYASRREMVPLLQMTFTEDERNPIVQKLESWNELYNIQGDQIIVPRSEHDRLVAKLQLAEVLPEDTSMGWETLLSDADVFTPMHVHEDKKKIILQMQLARTVENFPGVSKATVYINKGDKRRLNNIMPVSTASVFVETKGSQVPRRKMANSIAGLISGAVNRLQRENVTVVVDGATVSVSPPGEELATDYIELLKHWEDYLRGKIAAHMPPGSLVHVTTKLQNTSTHVEEKKYTNQNEGSLVVQTESSTREETRDRIQEQEEPGLQANVTEPMAAGGNRENEAIEDAIKKSEVFPGQINTIKTTPPGGYAKDETTAVVSVPLSYFKAIARKIAGTETEPTLEDIEKVKVAELPKLKNTVLRAIGLADSQYEAHVYVDTYWEEGIMAGMPGMVGDGGEAEAVQAGFSVAGIAQQYGKHIAVTALAMISLVMVLMMVRKSVGPVEIEEEEASSMMSGSKPMDALSPDDVNYDEEGASDSLLAGVELDSQAVRSQRILQQVRELVADSPDIATTLVAKWLKQDG